MRVSVPPLLHIALVTAMVVPTTLVGVPGAGAADGVTLTDLTPPLSPIAVTRLDVASATVTFQVLSTDGQARVPTVIDRTEGRAFAPTEAARVSGDRVDGVWQAQLTLGSFMDGLHEPRVRICPTSSTCVNRPLATDLDVRGSDWPTLRRVTQQPRRLPAGQVSGAVAEGRVEYSTSESPVAGLTVRLIRNEGGNGTVVDQTGDQGRFTSPWPWRQRGQDPARLAIVSSAFPGVRIDGTPLGNPYTRFRVPTPRVPPVVATDHRVRVKGVVTPGYPASRMGRVKLQVLTASGWATRDQAQVRAVGDGSKNKARYRLRTRFSNDGRHLLRVVKPAALCGDPCRVARNRSDRFPVLIGDRVGYAEARLDKLGVPVGSIDGDVDARTRQAFCAWRDMTGRTPSRSGLTPSLLRSIMRSSSLPDVDRTNGIYVNKTCQVLLQVKHKAFKRVVWVSTGAAGYDTPNGTGAIFRKVKGWVESSLYPGAYMLDPMYFFPERPGIAIHGSVSNDLVKPQPASHGCVRTWRPQVRRIFNDSPIGTKVKVYGEY